jgi:hypothetical protein
MKLPFLNTVLSVTQRSRETLVGITQKTKLLFGASPGTESSDNVDKNMQRFAQTSFGRVLQRWSGQQNKGKKKRRFPVVTVIFLALFTAMLIMSLLDRNPVSADPAQNTQASSLAQSKSGALHTAPSGANAVLEANLTQCPDKSIPVKNGLCDPSTFTAPPQPEFGPLYCPANAQQYGNDPSDDPCNPWGVNSTEPDKTKATTWEGLSANDQWCVALTKNTDLTARYQPGVTQNHNANASSCSGNMPIINTGSWFPCAQDEATISGDWLSGDSTDPTVTDPAANPAPGIAGHMQTTYLLDTLDQGYIVQLYPIMLGLGLMLLSPTLILAGYHILIAGTSFRYAEAITALSRVFLAGAAVVMCSSLLGSLARW